MGRDVWREAVVVHPLEQFDCLLYFLSVGQRRTRRRSECALAPSASSDVFWSRIAGLFVKRLDGRAWFHESSPSASVARAVILLHRSGGRFHVALF